MKPQGGGHARDKPSSAEKFSERGTDPVLTTPVSYLVVVQLTWSPPISPPSVFIYFVHITFAIVNGAKV